MALVEDWMDLAECIAFPELPWIGDRHRVDLSDMAEMRGACRSCGVIEQCRDFVSREAICGGFWAGEFREPADSTLDGAA